MWTRVKNNAILAIMFVASWLPLHTQVMYGPSVATSQQGGQILGPLPFPAQADTLVLTSTAANGVNVYSVLLQTAPTQTGPWTACITSTVTGGSVSTATVTSSCKPQGALYYRVYVQSGAPLVMQLVDVNGTAFVLSAPRGVVYDSTHNIAYIADSGNNRILVYNFATNVTSLLAPSGGYPTTGLSNPGQLGQNNNADIYIADTGNNRIVDYNIAAGTASVLATTGFTLNAPDGVCGEPGLSVYIADTANNRLLHVAGGTTTVAATGTPGGLALSSPHACQPFNGGTGLAGDIYVADTGNSRIVQFHPGGPSSTVLSTAPLTVNAPMGVTAYNNASGNFPLIADTGSSRIVQSASGVGSVLPIYNQPGQIQLKNPNQDYVLSVNGFSNFFIADTGNNRIILSAYPNTGGFLTVGVVGINSLVGHSGSGGTFVCDQAHDCAALDGTNIFPNLQTLNISKILVLEDSIGAPGISGQVMTNVGGKPLWQSSPGPSLLPGNPNVLYTTVANGDQSGTVVHDVSGSGNDATFAGVGFNPTWAGTGLDFTFAHSTIQLPATVNLDQTFCMVIYTPFWTQTGTNPSALTQVMGNNTGSSSLNNWWLAQNFSQELFGSIGLSGHETTTNMGMHAICEVIFQQNAQVAVSLPGDQLFTDGFPITNLNAGNTNGTLHTGNISVGASNQPSNFILYYFAGWTGKLTATQIQQVSLSMLQQVAARGVQMTPNTSYPNPIQTQYLIGVGDSITNGNGVSAGQNWLAVSTPTATFTKMNFGVAGFGTPQMIGEENWQVTPLCNVQGGQSIAIIFGGTNDAGGGLSVQQASNNLSTFAFNAKKAGCIPMVGTMISRGAGLDSYKDTLNPLIRAAARKGAYFLIDFASDPNMGCDGCDANATFFQGDTVHPTAAGQALLGVAASNAINYVTGSSAANPTVYTANTQTLASGDAFVIAIPTAAAAYTLPSCTGVVGSTYTIFNKSAGAFTITFSGGGSQPIIGSATLAQNVNAQFTAQLISNAAAGCNWLRGL